MPVDKDVRFILADPSFISFSGHCFEYINSLRTPLLDRGHEVVIVGNRGMAANVSRMTGALNLFTYWCDARPTYFGISPHSRFGRYMVRMRHERSVFKDLKDLDKRISIRSRDVLVLNTFRHWGLRGIVRWLESLSFDKAPQIVLILHFTAYPIPGLGVNDRDMYNDAFKAIEASTHRARIMIMADSESLMTEFRSMSCLDFKLAPIPHSKSSKPVSSTSVEQDHSRPLTVTFAGEARTNKGFQFMPFVVGALNSTELSRSCSFEIQNFIHNPNEHFYKIAMGKLKNLKNCIFFPNQLNDEEYSSFLDRADIVLIPYLLENYHTQTSGIYAEAVSLGTPVIVPMGTWMAVQVQHYGGGLTFPPGDQLALYEALVRVVENYGVFKRDAENAALAWTRFHTSDRLLSIIGEAGAVGL